MNTTLNFPLKSSHKLKKMDIYKKISPENKNINENEYHLYIKLHIISALSNYVKKLFMNEFIILFRETLEAALIVGIIYFF